MQLIYILFSMMIFFTLLAGTNKIRLRTLVFAGGMIAFGAVMTYLYSGDAFLQRLLTRVFVVEAISEYAAYATYYNQHEPKMLGLFLEKLHKILDSSVITFSQSWKEEIASKTVRGFASIGLFCELFVSFWWVGVLFVPLYGLAASAIDNRIYSGRNLDFWAVAGVIVAAMMMKGLNSQVFAGGLLILFFVSVMSRMSFRRDTSPRTQNLSTAV